MSKSSPQSFEIDDTYKKILTIVQEKPSLSHSRVAKLIKMSQPAVGSRVGKLEDKNLLGTQYGVNFASNRLCFAIVTMQVRNVADKLEELRKNPQVQQVFKVFGKYNMLVWVGGINEDEVSRIVKDSLAGDPDIPKLEIVFMGAALKDLAVPFPLPVKEENECPEYASLFSTLLNIDEDDKRIINYLQDETQITHTEIGRRIGKSQPAVGARVKKLMKKNVLKLQRGPNFKTCNELELMQVRILTNNSKELGEKIRACKVFSTGFINDKMDTIITYVAGKTFEEIDSIIDHCIRADPAVETVETTPVLDTMYDLVFNYDFEHEYSEVHGCSECMYYEICQLEEDVESLITGDKTIEV